MNVLIASAFWIILAVSVLGIWLVVQFSLRPPSSFVHRDVELLSLDERLEMACLKSPIDRLSGRHRLLIAVVNEGMLEMAQNWLCSLQHAGIEPREFLLIAFDEDSYQTMKYLTPSVVYFHAPLSKHVVNVQQIVQFYRFLHFRTGIALELLKLGCDVITSDTDIIFLSHFSSLFSGDADLEVQHDSKVDIDPNQTIPAPWKLNLGFHVWRSNNVTIRLVSQMLETMKAMPKNHDQSVLRKMTAHLPMRWDNSRIVVDLSSIFPDLHAPQLFIRHIDGLLAVNAGGMFTHGYDKWRRAATQRNIRRPALIHFFHLGSYGEKSWWMKRTRLWFLDFRGDCKPNTPKGVEWEWWNPNLSVRNPKP
jgi:hypothetical protein